MLAPAEAHELALAWIRAWNDHDLEAIMAHYADDVEFGSPLVAARGLAADGILRGSDALRSYFRAGLEAREDLAFELDTVSTGADGVAIAYHWRGGKVHVVETMQLRDGKVVRARAHYIPEQIGRR